MMTPDEITDFSQMGKFDRSNIIININDKNMLTSLKLLFSSSRFLSILAIGILQALVLFGIVTSVHGDGLIQIIQMIIGAGVIVKTVDRNTGDATITAANTTAGVVK